MSKDNYHYLRAVMHCQEILDRLNAGEPISCGSS